MKSNPSFFATTIGQTALMSATGVVLYLYVVSHLLGNLIIFLDRGQINAYGILLHSHPVMLWTARSLLLIAVLLHIATGTKLWWFGRHTARPIPYARRKHVPPGYASRTMMRSGAIILLFVIFHILHLTTGSTGLPFHEHDIYANVTAGFRIPWVSAVYLIAMVFLGMHLYHGLWTIFPLLGLSDPRLTRILKWVTHLFAISIAAGFISIPVAVLAGWLRP